MATYNKGIMGGFSGKVGTVVGTTWRGKEVVRSLPQKTSKPSSPAQLLQQEKFKLVHNFLKPIKPLLSDYFGVSEGIKKPYDLAISYHLKEAVVPEGGTFRINYPRVLIGIGSLRGLEAPVLTVLPGSSLQINWANNSEQGYAYADDQLLLVLYNEGNAIFEIYNGVANRDAGQATLAVPPEFMGAELQCWATFRAADNLKAAMSSYLGVVIVEG